MKLQFGCGENRLPDFENHDNDLDVCVWPLPFPDGSADIIFAEHLGEHLNSPQLLGFLTECYRILKPGGVMRLCCPVIGPHLKREHARDLAINHGHQQTLNRESMFTFLWMAGFDWGSINATERRDIDGHWKIIGKEKDDLETCRMEARK